MITYAFALVDTKVGLHHPPFFFNHEALAVRAVCDLARDRKTSVGRHPNDFELVRLGQFDDATGQLQQLEKKHYGTALALALAQETQPELPLAAD